MSTRFPLLSHSSPLADQIVEQLADSPATRSELCEALSVSRPALGRGLIDLLDSGFVEQSTIKSGSKRGKPVAVLSLRKNMAYAIGFDVERSRSTAIVVDRAGRVLVELEHAYSGGDWAKISQDLCSRLKVRLSVSGINSQALAMLGVGVPFPVRRTVFSSVPDVTRKSEFYHDELLHELRDTFVSFWDVPMLFDNTVCMSGLVEAARYAHKECRHLYVRVSGGVGGCFVHSDDSGLAHVLTCELGHMNVARSSKIPMTRCYCGQTGCVETIAGLEKLCARCGEHDFDEIVRRFYERDSKVVQAINDAALALGQAVAEAITLFAPETVTIGGEVPSRIKEFTDLVKLEAFSHIMPEMLRELTMEAATGDSLTCARGAVWAAFGYLSRTSVAEN